MLSRMFDGLHHKSKKETTENQWVMGLQLSWLHVFFALLFYYSNYRRAEGVFKVGLQICLPGA